MENNKPKISVIIPIYNNEMYLSECIRSVIDSSFSDLEVILIDDGSTDNAPLIMDEYSKKDTRIRVIHKKNEGSAAGRNLGIDLAVGEYVAFVESDDKVEPELYEKLYKKAISTGADIVKCNFYFCQENIKRMDDRLEKVAIDQNVFKAIDRPAIFRCHASIWAGLYSKKFLDEKKLRFLVTPKATYSDMSWMAMTFSYADKIAIVNEPLYDYTFDNPESSYKKAGLLYKYKIYHSMESNRIMREAGVFDLVKEDMAVTEFNNVIDGARGVAEEQKEQCFNEINELFLDLFDEDFKYLYFDNYKRGIIESVLQNEIKDFYDLIHSEFIMINPQLYKDKKMAIVCAGRCGKSYAHQLINNGAEIIGLFDNNPVIGGNVNKLDSIVNFEYDYALISVIDRSAAYSVKKQLISLGVPADKIIWKMPFKPA